MTADSTPIEPGGARTHQMPKKGLDRPAQEEHSPLMDTTEHTPSPTTAVTASQPGALDGFVSTCTCGVRQTDTQ